MTLAKLAINAGWSMGAHILSRGSLMVAAIFLARSLETDAFARYSYFQLTISMIAAYAAMGLGVTAARHFAEAGKSSAESDAFPIGTLWALSLILSFIAFVTIIMLPVDCLSNTLVIPNWQFALGVSALTLQVIPAGAILGLERYKYAAKTSVLTSILTLIFAAIASSMQSENIAIIAIIVVAFIQAIGDSIIVIRCIGLEEIKKRTSFSLRQIERVYKFAGPLLVVTLMSSSGAWIVGRMIVNRTSAYDFALYSIGLQWFALVLLVPAVLSRVILPLLVKNDNEGGDVANSTLVAKGATLAAAMGLLTAVSVGAALPYLIKVYGDKYYGSERTLAVFLLAAVLASPINVIGSAILAANRQSSWMLITAFWLASLVALAHTLSKLGAIGGAISLAGAAFVQVSTTTAYARLKRII